MKLDFNKFEFSDTPKGAMHTNPSDMDIRKTITSYSYDVFSKIHDSINKMNNDSVVSIYKDIQERLRSINTYLFNYTHLDPNAKMYLTEIFVNLKKLEFEFSNKIIEINNVK